MTKKYFLKLYKFMDYTKFGFHNLEIAKNNKYSSTGGLIFNIGQNADFF